MNQQWIAGILIAFGIVVAVAGVIAYLRLIKATRRGERRTADIRRPDDAGLPHEAPAALRSRTRGDSSE